MTRTIEDIVKNVEFSKIWNDNGEFKFRFPETNIYFVIRDNIMYGIDIDDENANVFKGGDFFKTLKGYGINLNEFYYDFDGCQLDDLYNTHTLDIGL